MSSESAAQGRCLCAERDLLGDHEEPCAGFGTRSDELCEQAEREAVAAGEWPPESPAATSLGPPPIYHFKGNMEYAAPGMNEWARQAWAEIERLRREIDSLRPHVEGIGYAG